MVASETPAAMKNGQRGPSQLAASPPKAGPKTKPRPKPALTVPSPWARLRSSLMSLM